MKKTNTTIIAGIEFEGKGVDAVRHSLRKHDIKKAAIRYMNNKLTRLETARVELYLGKKEYDQIINDLRDAANGYRKQKLNPKEYVGTVCDLINQGNDLVRRINQFNDNVNQMTRSINLFRDKLYDAHIDAGSLLACEFDSWNIVIDEISKLYRKFSNLEMTLAVTDCRLATMWTSVDEIRLMTAELRCKRRLARGEEW